MNTTTMRLYHYLHDDEEHYEKIQGFVGTVRGKESHVAQVSVWLKQQFADVYAHLDQLYIEWEELARRFILEFTPIADENLPRLVVALVDAAYWLEDECSEQKQVSGFDASYAAATIEEWKQQWQDALSISFPTFLHRCRLAPSQSLLDGILALYDALMESARMAGDVAFWNEGGQGAEAQQIGEQTIQSTWWAFHALLRKWADDHKFVICNVLDRSYDALLQDASRRESFGVIEPQVARIRDLRTYVFGER